MIKSCIDADAVKPSVSVTISVTVFCPVVLEETFVQGPVMLLRVTSLLKEKHILLDHSTSKSYITTNVLFLFRNHVNLWLLIAY